MREDELVPPHAPSVRREVSDVDVDIHASSSIASSSSMSGGTRPVGRRGRLSQLIALLGLRLGRRLAWMLRDDHVFLIVMAAAVGVTSGVAAGLLLLWIDWAYRLFPHADEADSAWRWTIVVGIPVVGGLLVGALRVIAARLLRRPLVTGVAGVVESVSQRGGELGGGSALVTGLGTGLTIGSGGSVGHEGPTVAIGAVVGSVVSRFFGLQMRRRVAMVGAGCAGGLAAAFNTPLAGVIFTVELVFGRSVGGTVGTMSVFAPLIVAAVAGTFTSHAIFGTRQEFQVSVHESATLPEYGFYVLLAIVAGIVATSVGRVFLWSEGYFSRLRLAVWAKPALGGLGVGLMAALVSNELLGAGRVTVDAALHGNLLWDAALLLLVLKVMATALTLGSGGFGGIFMPALYIGSCLGSLVGSLAEFTLAPELQGVGAYALVGMGALFAGLMQAPLTPIVMIFEMTHDYDIMLPLMLACILAVVVSRRLNPIGFYDAILRMRGFVFRHEMEGEIMKRGRVRELMVVPSVVLHEGALLEEVRRVCLDDDLGSVFVVDDERRVLGFIDGHLLARRLLGEQGVEQATANALMSTRITLLYANDTLAGAMTAFSRTRTEVLPVVDNERHLVGVIRRGDLIAHYSDKVLGQQEESVEVGSGDQPHEEVALGKGVVIDHEVVGRAWAGRSLADLDMRSKTGVVVLEWRRNDRVVPIDPRAPLKLGDVLTVAGRREAILGLRRLL